MSERTLKVTSPHYMEGADVNAWRETLRDKLAHWRVDYPLAATGPYDVAVRSATATVLHGLGIAQDAMEHGVTPALRTKVRNSRLTAAERERYESRADWRKRLAAKHEQGGVSSPLAKIITHANGWSARHDGVDLICPANAVGHAICKARVVRADTSGWWGKGAVASPGHPIGDGDGIVMLEALVTVGPIREGMYFGYGHAEHPSVDVGDVVEAGQPICRAGFARAWHFHWMVNAGGAQFRMAGGKPRGVGDRNPWPIVSYCIEHA